MIFVYQEHEIIVTNRVPIGYSVTGDNYKIYLVKKLQTEICKNRPGMLKCGVSIFYFNVRPHIRAPVLTFLEKCGWERLKRPLCSTDLNFPDFDLFKLYYYI